MYNEATAVEKLPTTLSITEQLKPYLFSVEQREVGYGMNPACIFPKNNLVGTSDYQSIVRADNDKLISIMPSTYKMVANREVILPVLNFLDNFDNKWYIDDTHSFVEDGRMRLQITFPNLIVSDGISDIALSLFLHNSYNGVEGVRGFWGAIRGICSNGIIFGNILGNFYHRHTSGINLDLLKEQVIHSTEKLPVIQERINILQNLESKPEQFIAIEKTMGKKISNYVAENYDYTESQWVLLNILTYYVSHIIDKRQRSAYQMNISKLFNF